MYNYSFTRLLVFKGGNHKSPNCLIYTRRTLLRVYPARTSFLSTVVLFMNTPTLRMNLTVGWGASPKSDHYTQGTCLGVYLEIYACARILSAPHTSLRKPNKMFTILHRGCLPLPAATIHGGPYSGSTRSKFLDERRSSSTAFLDQVRLVTHRLPSLPN